jgi:dTDP-4-dehydrorhamnose 3,5-epimerase-like enzyme
MNSWAEPTVIDVPAFRDELGALGVVEKDNPFPFAIKRVYFLYDVPSGAVRGSHAHRNLRQLIIAASGSFEVTLDDGRNEQSFRLSSPDKGLTVPPGYWRTLTDFSSGSTALVLASEEYDPDDYIRDYDEFTRWAQK